MKDKEKICTIVFDDMSIRACLNYNAALDIIDGFASDDGSTNKKMATQVLVFMLRGVITNWKQVIYIFYLFSYSIILK